MKYSVTQHMKKRFCQSPRGHRQPLTMDKGARTQFTTQGIKSKDTNCAAGHDLAEAGAPNQNKVLRCRRLAEAGRTRNTGVQLQRHWSNMAQPNTFVVEASSGRENNSLNSLSSRFLGDPPM